MYLLFVLVGLAYGAFYVAFYVLEVPGAATERFGRRVPLPLLGRWQVERGTAAAKQAIAQGFVRETRVVPSNLLDAQRGELVRQVRYRSRATGKITRFESETRERWPRQYVA